MPTWAPGCAAASAAAWRRLLHALRRPNLFEIWRVQFAVLPGQGRAEQSARSREQLGAVRTQELLELHLFSQIYMQDEKCSFQFRFFARLRLTNWWMSRCALVWLGPKPSARAWISFGSLSLSLGPRPTLVRRMFGQANDRQRVPSILIFECIMTGEAARGGQAREEVQRRRGW